MRTYINWAFNINQIKCVVNFSDRYWKHPRSEISYLVRIEFIHSDVWTRIKELHLLRKCKLSTQSISLFSWPLLYIELLLSSALSPGSLTRVKRTLELCPLHRRKWYSYDIRDPQDAAVHFHIHRLHVELVFGMQMQWLLRAEMERPNVKILYNVLSEVFPTSGYCGCPSFPFSCRKTATSATIARRCWHVDSCHRMACCACGG